LSLDRLGRSIREGDCRVTVVLAYTPHCWEVMELFPGFVEHPILAFAMDLGTTSIALYLLDLREGKVIKDSSVPNPQIRHGEDILTRILFARREENRRELQRLVIDTVNENISRMLEGLPLGHSARGFALTVAANTTMSHLFLGLDPTGICREPYIPVANRFPLYHACDLGLNLHPHAPVYVFPNAGSYFGGDLVAGIVAAGMHCRDEVTLLVDVGTNAEVVLGNREWLIACAGAAGPALEGGVIESGMMALPGAVDRVRVDSLTLEPTYHVLGEEKPRGICGSGVIDLVAELFNAGVLTVSGKIDVSITSERIVLTPDAPAYVLAFGRETSDGRDLSISETDIGIFLKSKAAMYTILSVIVGKVGLTFEDIACFYVAGAFGNHIDPSMAIRIGMLPDLPIEKYRGVGNTAGCGAAMLLLDRSLFLEIDKICDKITYVELNVDMELMNEFRGALFLPHTDPRLFPSVSIPDRATDGGRRK
jgi:uncharacterized 2Fe-2S/4Fe-4S cluster protein (DUF4445 family)